MTTSGTDAGQLHDFSWCDSVTDFRAGPTAPPTVEAHIAEQAKESAAELRAHGWFGDGQLYAKYAGLYPPHCEALDARLGRESSHEERSALVSAIRERLDEGRPVASKRPL